MVHQRFPCDDEVIGLRYRNGLITIEKRDFGFIDIWRPLNDLRMFKLIHKVAVPSIKYRNHEVLLNSPLPVKAGDVLGIHHPRNAKMIAFMSQYYAGAHVQSNRTLEMFKIFYFNELKDDVLPVGIEIQISSKYSSYFYYNFKVQAIMNRIGMYISVAIYYFTPFRKI